MKRGQRPSAEQVVLMLRQIEVSADASSGTCGSSTPLLIASWTKGRLTSGTERLK